MIAPLEEIETGQRDGEQETRPRCLRGDQTSKRIEENNLYQMSKLASLGEVATASRNEINQPLGVIRLAATNALTGLQMGCRSSTWRPSSTASSSRRAHEPDHRPHSHLLRPQERHGLEPSDPMEAIDGPRRWWARSCGWRMSPVTVTGGAARECGCYAGRTNWNRWSSTCCRTPAMHAYATAAARGRGVSRRHHHRHIAGQGRGWAVPQVVIRVKDNAGGIPENVIDKVFQPFFHHQAARPGHGPWPVPSARHHPRSRRRPERRKCL